MAELARLRSEIEALAAEMGRLAQNIRAATMSRELKADGSIVTLADRELERLARERLPTMAPGSTVWGEEEGYDDPGDGGLWLVDPIDGTSNFAFGSPLWGVSIALLREGSIVAGSVALPDLGEVYSASLGGGASVNGVALPPIPPGPIRDEELVSYSDGLFGRFPGTRWPGKMRYAGAYVVDASFVACQRLRGIVGHKGKLYDVAACVLMGLELGAEVRYASGKPFEPGALLGDRTIPEPFAIFPRDSGFLLR